MNKLFASQSKMFTEIDKASLDVNNEKIDKLKELFPNIVSDGKIDWKALKLVLGDKITEDDERYRFTWNGKSKAIRESSVPSMDTLRPDKKSSKDWDTTENLYIEGDNLEVLKILQNSYNGKIKMVYIDPPYNTGNDFVYEDDFTLSSEEVEKQEGLKDKKGTIQTVDRLVKNSKDSAKYHTNWLNMMYPRISIARDLLKDDGAIFISINDNEVHNLRKLCNEIFGEDNFVGEFIWKSRQNKDNRNITGASIDHEYILCFSKTSGVRSLRGSERKTEQYKNPDNDERGLWVSGNMVGLLPEDQRPNCHYDLIHPEGGINYGKPKMGWRYDKNTMNRLIKENRIIWPKDPEGRPRRKVFLKELNEKKPGFSSVLGEKIYTRDGTKEMETLFEYRAFDFPKPTTLISELLRQGSERDDLILDFFSGSATTAHAVMKLNLEDGGNRKYIMVQLPEKTEKKSEAYRKGYENICEIGKERIRRAGEKIKNDNPEKDLSMLDIGFKAFKWDSSNFNEWDTSYESMMKSIKDSANDNYTTYKEEREPLDLVYEILLKEGHQLTENIEEIIIGSDIVYKIADGVMYIFLGKLTDEIIEKIVEMKKEAYDLFGLNNPSIVLNEAYLDTEIKANAKKNFESNGIIDIKTL